MSVTGLTPGQEITIHPQHPFYGGVQGVFEFTSGKNDEIMVFSKPRASEDEVKIYFMLRPNDMLNYITMMNYMSEEEETQDEETPVELPEIPEQTPYEGDPPPEVAKLSRLGVADLFDRIMKRRTMEGTPPKPLDLSTLVIHT